MISTSWLAAALVLGAALVAAPPDSLGQTAPPAQTTPPTQPAQPAQPAAPAAFSAERLEQLVAPIALYPDAVLTNVLMASTYPLEVVEASRWLKKNSSLKGSALEKALEKEDWEASVKSLCVAPEVIEKLNENLDWMQDLGDAFLGQQAEVMDAVQRMRAKASEAGNLKSNEQQTVTQDEKIIIIEPAGPEVVYVPSYSPTVVYGGWSYPSYYYPAMYVPPPPYPPGAPLVTFTAGVMFGAMVWGAADWHHHDVYHHPPGPPPRPGGPPPGARPGGPPPPPGGRPGGPPPGGPQGQAWQHNPEHRKGVNYQNPAAAQKYGGAGGSSQVSRDQARGRNGQQPGTGAGGPTGSRPPAGGGGPSGSRPSAGGGGPSASQQPARGGGPSAGTRDVSKGSGGGASQRPTTSDRSYSSPGGSKNSAYSGSRSPRADTSASSRGSSSRGTSSYSGSKSSGSSRPSGGGSRPSGGGGGGRGGGGGGRGGGGRR